jgi:hypothetical protein
MSNIDIILFRGQTEQGEWVYGDKVLCRNKTYILEHINDTLGFDERYLEWIEVIPSTVGQYTGLNDENDKMIFKGHKLKYETLIGVVMFGLFYQSKCNEYDCTHYGWYVHTQNGDINLGNQRHHWEIIDESKEI